MRATTWPRLAPSSREHLPSVSGRTTRTRGASYTRSVREIPSQNRDRTLLRSRAGPTTKSHARLSSTRGKRTSLRGDLANQHEILDSFQAKEEVIVTNKHGSLTSPSPCSHSGGLKATTPHPPRAAASRENHHSAAECATIKTLQRLEAAHVALNLII